MTNQYIPISYGDFSSNSPTSLTLTKDMYPMPFLLGANGYRFISTNTVSGGSKPHYYDKNGDIFMQLTEQVQALIPFPVLIPSLLILY